MKVLIIPGSLRPNSVGNQLIPYVEKELASHDGVEVEVATLDDIRLPLFDGDYVPMAGGEIPYDEAKKWSQKVDAADAFVFIVPEYNANISGVQKNAIDWLSKEWNGKKAAIVNYNNYDEKRGADALRATFGIVQLVAVEPATYLKFPEDIGYDGTIVDQAAFKEKLKATIAALVEA